MKDHVRLNSLDCRFDSRALSNVQVSRRESMYMVLCLKGSRQGLAQHACGSRYHDLHCQVTVVGLEARKASFRDSAAFDPVDRTFPGSTQGRNRFSHAKPNPGVSDTSSLFL